MASPMRLIRRSIKRQPSNDEAMAARAPATTIQPSIFQSQNMVRLAKCVRGFSYYECGLRGNDTASSFSLAVLNWQTRSARFFHSRKHEFKRQARYASDRWFRSNCPCKALWLLSIVRFPLLKRVDLASLEGCTNNSKSM
jgi:hypothetical protein